MKKPRQLTDVISKIINSGIPDVLWFLSNTKQSLDDGEVLSILVSELIKIEEELIRIKAENIRAFFLEKEETNDGDVVRELAQKTQKKRRAEINSGELLSKLKKNAAVNS